MGATRGTGTGIKPEAENEKVETGPRTAPPESMPFRRPESAGQNQPEKFSRAERLMTSSIPLLRKLHLPRPSRWKGKQKWSQKGKEPQNPNGQQEEEEEEEDTHEGSTMIPRKFRSSSSASIAAHIHGDDDGNDSDDDGEDNDEDTPWMKTAWNKVRPCLPSLGGCFHGEPRNIGYHHVLMAISTVAIVMLSLLLASCSSHGMRKIYILELSYWNGSLDSGEVPVPNPSFYSVVANISTTGDLTVRVGYFGTCMESASRGWTCGANAGDLVPLVGKLQDPLNVLAIADNFKDEVIVSAIIIMSIVMICLAIYCMSTFPGWHDEVDPVGEEIEIKPFPSKLATHLVLAFLLLALLFLITAILWQHVAVVAHAASTETAFQGAVRGKVGSVAMGLGWGSIGVNIIVVLGISVTIVNIRLLESRLDDLTDAREMRLSGMLNSQSI